MRPSSPYVLSGTSTSCPALRRLTGIGILGALLLVLTLLLPGWGGGTEMQVDADRSEVPSGQLEVRARLLPAFGAASDGEVAESAPVPFLDESRTLDGRTYRLATLPAEDSRITWPVELSPASRLRFGYTANVPQHRGEEQSRVELTLTVALHRDGETRDLWSRSLPVADLADEVREVEVEIPATGGDGELIFSSGTAPGESIADLVVSWENPLLLSPASRYRPRVLVVCIDTLRADHLAPDQMPYISKRLRSAAVFRNAYTNSPWSLPSIATILTGLAPGEHHAGLRTDLGKAKTETNYNAETSPGGIELVIGGRRYRFQMLHHSVPTIQEILGDSGWLTGAIHNNGYINYPTRVLQGMDHVQHYRARDAALGSDLALDWLRRNHDVPQFLFLHYIDPHQWTKRIPKPLQGKDLDDLDDEDRETILGEYADLVRYTDRHLERVFTHLEESGAWEDTYVMLLSDHGERFFEDGAVGSHGGGFQESVIRVPLALWGPGIEAGVYPTRVSLADVVPTLLEVLGLEDPGERKFGRSVMPILSEESTGDRTVVNHGVLWSEDHAAWLEGPWKLVWYPRRNVSRLYDLRSGSAKLEDVAADHPEVVERLRRQLGSYLRRSRADFRSLDYQETTVDEETLESLKALGYIQ